MLARSELDEIGKILLKAAEALEEKGHAKGIRQNAIGALCAIGAVGAVLPHNNVWYSPNNSCPVLNRLAEHICPELTKEDRRWAAACSEILVAHWNNKEVRTKQEVIDKFREVAYDPQYAKVT